MAAPIATLRLPEEPKARRAVAEGRSIRSPAFGGISGGHETIACARW